MANTLKRKIYRWLKNGGHSLSLDERYLRKLHNKFLGQHCIIIGMGPSLLVNDLEALSKFTSFGCNKIYLTYSKTDFRPDYYSICDIELAKNNASEILESKPKGTQFICSSSVQTYLGIDGIHYYKRNGNITIKKDQDFNKLSHRGILSHGYSIIIDQIQLAFYMGFSTVYLTGIDFNYKVGDKRFGTTAQGVLTKDVNTNNHFLSNYFKSGETWTVPNLELMKNAFQVCREQFEKNNRKLINVSRETQLDVLPRQKFEDIIR